MWLHGGGSWGERRRVDASIRLFGDEDVFDAWLFDLIGFAILRFQGDAFHVDDFDDAVGVLIGLPDHALVVGFAEVAVKAGGDERVMIDGCMVGAGWVGVGGVRRGALMDGNHQGGDAADEGDGSGSGPTFAWLRAGFCVSVGEGDDWRGRREGSGRGEGFQ